MQVDSTNNTTATAQTSQTKASEQSTKASSLFDSLMKEDLKPQDLSYEAYKTLSLEEVNKLYPKEEVPEDNEKAVSLHTKANGSDDEILNKILFNKELKTEPSNAFSFISQFLDFAINSFNNMKIDESKLNEPDMLKNMGFGGFASMSYTSFSYQSVSYQASSTQASTSVTQQSEKLTATALFGFFDHMKMDYNQNKEQHKDSDSTFRKHGDSILAMFDSIQMEYSYEKQEYSASLSSYMNNTKPNPIETANKQTA